MYYYIIHKVKHFTEYLKFKYELLNIVYIQILYFYFAPNYPSHLITIVHNVIQKGECSILNCYLLAIQNIIMWIFGIEHSSMTLDQTKILTIVYTPDNRYNAFAYIT